jgi:ATP synthase protein I
MDSRDQRPQRRENASFPDIIGAKARRKLKAKGEQHRSIWFGMGMFGMVGWSVATPTLLGVVVGLWIDRRWPSRFYLKLKFLLIGVLLGCFKAGYRLRAERDIDKKRKK